MTRTSKRAIRPGFDDLEGRQLLSTLPGTSPSVPAITAFQGHVSAAASRTPPLPAQGAYYFLRDRATGFYLDSNRSADNAGPGTHKVYTLNKNGGTYQKWKFIPAGGGTFFLLDDATGFYLDSNASGKVYTLRGNGGNNQRWQPVQSIDGNGYFLLMNVATHRFLGSDEIRSDAGPGAHRVYTTPQFGPGTFQEWHLERTTPSWA